MKPIALITGATSGIGEATAKMLAGKYALIICGRRTERLEKLAKELNTDVYPATFDVRDKEAVFQTIEGLPEDWKNIEVLINNAGNAHGLSTLQEGDMDDWDAMIDINVKGLLYVSRAILPGMIKRKSGHIINIGSVAGLEVYPNGNVYCASKHAVDALNKGMRLDLNGTGVKTGAINPGLVQTEFSEVRFKGDKARADRVYQGFEALRAEDIAEIIDFVISRPQHVNIADLLIFPTAQATSTMVHKSK